MSACEAHVAAAMRETLYNWQLTVCKAVCGQRDHCQCWYHCCRLCFSAKETHQLAEASQARNDQLRAAFGLSEFYKDGSSMDPQHKAKEQAAEALAAAQKTYA